MISKIYGLDSFIFDLGKFLRKQIASGKTRQRFLDPDLFDPDLGQKPLFLISKKSKKPHSLNKSESNELTIHVKRVVLLVFIGPR